MKKQGTQWTSMCTTKVKGSTKLWGAQRSTELAFRSTDFHVPENLIFLALPFTPLWTQKIKILKKSVHIINLQMCTISDSQMMYGSWDMECNGENFFVILDRILPFYLINNPKNQNFEKMKKIPGDSIILHRCTINYNHMMYGYWDTQRDRQNFLLFWTIFCPVTPLTTWKIKILKKWKKHLEIVSFYIGVP